MGPVHHRPVLVQTAKQELSSLVKSPVTEDVVGRFLHLRVLPDSGGPPEGSEWWTEFP